MLEATTFCSCRRLLNNASKTNCFRSGTSPFLVSHVLAANARLLVSFGQSSAQGQSQPEGEKKFEEITKFSWF